jgi:hypothetical protein
MSHNGKRFNRPRLHAPWAAAMLVFGTALGLAAAPTPTAESLTTGEFAMLIAARINQYDASDAPSTPDAAAATLQKVGVKIRVDLSSPLTEGNAVEIFRQFGISLQEQDPDKLMDPDRAFSLVVVFGDSLASAGARIHKPDASQNHAGIPAASRIEVTPQDCQWMVRTSPCGGGGQPSCNPCMNCCLSQLGLTGKVCGRLCQKKNLIVCPTEPTP